MPVNNKLTRVYIDSEEFVCMCGNKYFIQHPSPIQEKLFVCTCGNKYYVTP